MNFIIAVTDEKWFEFLRRKPDCDEVNFWSPSANNFRALQPGEPFLFKLHAPHRKIVGGGFFVFELKLSCFSAWKSFGEANGARSEHEMRSRIAKYRKASLNDPNDFEIGCRILSKPFFFDESEWIPEPKSWSPNIVSYKTYDASAGEGKEIWEAVAERLNSRRLQDADEKKERYGVQHLAQQRLGQGSFRALVTEIYDRRCAVTQERTLPALEAAHIRPYSDGGDHEAPNGLLLRSDIHSLFDAGYVTVTPDHNFKVSEQIKKEFSNGHEYYALQGRINLPEDASQRPDPSALTWHNEHCFKE